MQNRSRVRLEFCATMGSTACPGPRSIFTTDSNSGSATSKTFLVAVLSKSVDFDKMNEKRPLRAFSSIFDEFKILTKVPHPPVKSDEKHDGEVTRQKKYMVPTAKVAR